MASLRIGCSGWTYKDWTGRSLCGRYPEAELERWAARVRDWRLEGRDVYAYFDNDVKSAAPLDALALKRLTNA